MNAQIEQDLTHPSLLPNNGGLVEHTHRRKQRIKKISCITIFSLLIIGAIIAIGVWATKFVQKKHRNIADDQPSATQTHNPSISLAIPAVPTSLARALTSAVPTEIASIIPTALPTGVPSEVETHLPTVLPTGAPLVRESTLVTVPVSTASKELPAAIPTAIPTGLPNPFHA